MVLEALYEQDFLPCSYGFRPGRSALIAAITRASDATLVTRNLRHFRRIPGLRVENWAD
jgi:predicted nucleic acid-binding protein